MRKIKKIFILLLVMMIFVSSVPHGVVKGEVRTDSVGERRDSVILVLKGEVGLEEIDEKEILEILKKAGKVQKNFYKLAEGKLGYLPKFEPITMLFENRIKAELSEEEIRQLRETGLIERVYEESSNLLEYGDKEGKIKILSEDITTLEENREEEPQEGNIGEDTSLLKVDTIPEGIYNPEHIFGEGELIAVIDTGFDVTHPDFEMEIYEKSRYKSEAEVNAKLASLNAAAGISLVKGKWFNNKFPFGYNYARNTEDIVEEGNSHGTHVAAIAAAAKNYVGQAPKAQLLGMSVIAGESDLGTPDRYAKAIEDSILLGATSINLSFGIPASTLKHIAPELAIVINKAKKAGVLINVSAGNEGYTDSGYGAPKLENPNYGTISAPALAPDVLSVASIDSDVVRLPYVTLGADEKIPYYPVNEEAVKPAYEEALEIVFAGRATKEELAQKNQDEIKGKVALIERGDIRFDEKVANVAALGAKVALVYDSEESNDWINMGIKDSAITCGFLKRKDGLKIQNRIMERLSVSKQLYDFASENAGELSDFSSFGPTPEFDLKPEITAVGGHIIAAQPGNAHSDKSGTSMAAPQISGIVALLNERVRLDKDLTITEDQKENLYPFLKNMIMSTAKPLVSKEGNLFASPRKQGAGLVSKENVLRSYAYISAEPNQQLKAESLDVAKVNLGAVGTSYELRFKVHNVSKTKTLKFRADKVTVQTDRINKEKPDRIVPVVAEEIMPAVSVTEEIEILPTQEKEVVISVTVPEEKDKELRAQFANGYFLEGFVRLTSLTEQQCDIGIPYIGFRYETPEGKKEFFNTPLIEKPIYDYEDLSEQALSRPRYYEMTGKNAFTALMSKNGEEEFVLGETTKLEDTVRSFDKTRIAFSPNEDGIQDEVFLRARFLGHYREDKIVVEDTTKSVVYNGKVNYSGTLGKKGVYEIGRRNQAVNNDGSFGMPYSQSENYSWRGKNDTKQPLPDGLYTYKFEVRGIADASVKQSYEFPIYLDTKKPEVRGIVSGANKIDMDIVENGSGIKSIFKEIYQKDGSLKTKIALTETGNKISVEYEKEELATTYLRIEDYAGNVYLSGLKALLNEGKTGAITVEIGSTYSPNRPPYGFKEEHYSIEVYDEEGNLLQNTEALPYGTYRVKIKFKTIKYVAKDVEREIVIDETHKQEKASFIVENARAYAFEIRLLSASPDGSLASSPEFKPEVIAINDEGLSEILRVSNDLGAQKKTWIKGRLPKGEWEIRVTGKPNGWVFYPQVLKLKIDELGNIETGNDLTIYHIGPTTNKLTIQTVIQAEGISEGDIRYKVFYDEEANDGNPWKNREMPNLSLLQPAKYKIKPVLPKEYYSIPDTKDILVSGSDITERFEIYKKSADDFGSIHIRSIVDGKERNDFPVEYKALDSDGEVETNLSKLSYGEWNVFPKKVPANYYLEKVNQRVRLGKTNKTAEVVFRYKRLSAVDKRGDLYINTKWGSADWKSSGEFNRSEAKPYKFILKRLDAEAEDIKLESAKGYMDIIKFQGIPYGHYEIQADLTGKTGFYVDKPFAQITVASEETDFVLNYAKVPFGELITKDKVLEKEGIVLKIPRSSEEITKAKKLEVSEEKEIKGNLKWQLDKIASKKRVAYKVFVKDEAEKKLSIPAGEEWILSIPFKGEKKEDIKVYYVTEAGNELIEYPYLFEEGRRVRLSAEHLGMFIILEKRKKVNYFEEEEFFIPEIIKEQEKKVKEKQEKIKEVKEEAIKQVEKKEEKSEEKPNIKEKDTSVKISKKEKRVYQSYSKKGELKLKVKLSSLGKKVSSIQLKGIKYSLKLKKDYVIKKGYVVFRKSFLKKLKAGKYKIILKNRKKRFSFTLKVRRNK